MLILKNEHLDIEFKAAVNRVNEHLEPFPADFLLRIYAYYKKANNSCNLEKQPSTIIDAFKTNALMQINSVSPHQAKQKYVELVNDYFVYKCNKSKLPDEKEDHSVLIKC